MSSYLTRKRPNEKLAFQSDGFSQGDARSETFRLRHAAGRYSHFLLGDRFNFHIVGIRFSMYSESMKTTIDIPDAALADAMRFTGAKTKREAVVKALEGFNRQQRVNDLIASFGTLDFASNDEIEAGDHEEIALREAGGRKS